MNKNDIENMIMDVKKSIDNKEYGIAKQFFDKLKFERLFLLHEKKLGYLENYFLEELTEENLDNSVEIAINIMLEKGIEKLNQNNFIVAIDYFQAGLYQTSNNIFNYYIGKAYYKLSWHVNDDEIKKNCLIEADRFLNKYLERGYKKSEKALMYLYYINRIMGRYGTAETNIRDCNMIEQLKGMNINLEQYIEELYNVMEKRKFGEVEQDYDRVLIQDYIEESNLLKQVKK